jgi:hypothetical protein
MRGIEEKVLNMIMICSFNHRKVEQREIAIEGIR